MSYPTGIIKSEPLLRKMLVWVHCAKRPLTVWELQHAVSIRPGSGDMHLPGVPGLDLMRKVSKGILELDETKQQFVPCGEKSVLYLAEKVGDWLTNADTEIARACITYLKFGVFRYGMSRSDAEFETKLKANTIHEYASCYWGHHVREATAKAERATRLLSDMNPEYTDMKNDVLDFLDGGTCLAAAVQTLQASGPYRAKKTSVRYPVMEGDRPIFPDYSQDVAKGMTGVHVAAWFGLVDIMRDLIDGGQPADSRNTCGRTPMSLAASRGHRAAVNTLISFYKADPKSAADGGFTALQFAACKGHADVVKDLCDLYGVDVEIGSETAPSALSCAAMYGHEEVACMLLDRGANANSIELNGWLTPLMFAVMGCNEAIVRMLLQKGAKVDMRDKSGHTALAHAAEIGYEPTAKILYDSSFHDPVVVWRQNPLYGTKALSLHARTFLKDMLGETSN